MLALSPELLALLNTATDSLQLCRVLDLHTLLCFRKLESNKLAVQSHYKVNEAELASNLEFHMKLLEKLSYDCITIIYKIDMQQ